MGIRRRLTMLNSRQPFFQLLSDGEIKQISQASLTLLENYGVRVDDLLVRNRLYHAGCRITNDRAYIPADLIGKVVDNIKKEVTFTGRTGSSVKVMPGAVVSHSSGGIPSIIDLETGKRRNANMVDFRQAIRLMNHLDQLDMPCALFYPEDAPGQISQVQQAEQLLRYSEKPVYGPGVSSPGEAKYIAELFAAHAGAEPGKSANPIGLVGISPESPLHFPKEITDTMAIIIGAGIPVVMLSAPVAGISAPLTLAGGIAQMNAEMLAFAVIAYTINPQTPLIYGSRLNYPNMRSGYSIWGLPEVGIGSAMAAQVAASYGFLSDVYGLACSSCTFDNQTGYEKAINGILPVTAGANMISGFGSMANLMIASFEQLVIDDETFAMLRKVKKGVAVNEDTLALDVTRDVLAGGTYLEQEHTVRHLRGGEIFIPQLGFDRSWTEWETAGSRDIRAIAAERARKILADDQYEPLSPALDKEVGRILAAAARELVVK